MLDSFTTPPDTTTLNRWRDAYQPGERYEATLDAASRHLGAHYTPSEVAEAIVARAFDLLEAAGGPAEPRICDPACGGGVFLVAAAQLLTERGVAAARALELVSGADIDPGAAAASRAALKAWAKAHGVTKPVINVTVQDTLTGQTANLDADIVVGNPPFQGQLTSDTARSKIVTERLQKRFGPTVKSLTDTAGLFLLAALEFAGADTARGARPAVVAMIQPRSVLSVRDARGVRAAVCARTQLSQVWVPQTRLFDADIDVAVVFATMGPHCSGRKHVRVFRDHLGADLAGTVSARTLAANDTWSPVWALSQAVPKPPRLRRAGTLSRWCDATAGFRDQFYGLAPHIRNDATRGAALRVATTALIDPVENRWGTRDVRIAKQRFNTPRLDTEALRRNNLKLAEWVARIARPKVIVATQTRVIEAAADPDGEYVALTPLIALWPRDCDKRSVEHLVAAVSAPVITAWAMWNYGGAAMATDALKLSASQVLSLPSPRPSGEWDLAAAAVLSPPARGDRAGWSAFGRVLNALWGVDDEALVQWWVERLPDMR